ncbi:N-acetyltransferase [Actinomadura rubrobrunea]|uniref:N-acetyltransferase n=1 Tax=Actinomadura rubrobrunea TaxID=115335 RepID=A0A9W6PV75_9ACTN|nr:GNAT family N-acetyltransferase [Actinomadura rubrobrunea]GLW63606.1 N-acetyltransferase [Actinomadura rubrobrunea]
MSDIRIRPAEPSDDRALADLNRRTWSPVHEVVPAPAPDAPFFDESHPADDVLVAEREGRVIGYVRLVRPYRDLASGAHVRQIQGLAVDPDERRRGVARALVDAACDWAVRQGARRVTLRVLGGNTPARRLYEAAGFTVEGVLPGEFFLDGRYVDDVLMGRTVQ